MLNNLQAGAFCENGGDRSAFLFDDCRGAGSSDRQERDLCTAIRPNFEIDQLKQEVEGGF
jgi:hypothetical protein